VLHATETTGDELVTTYRKTALLRSRQFNSNGCNHSVRPLVVKETSLGTYVIPSARLREIVMGIHAVAGSRDAEEALEAVLIEAVQHEIFT
jgi:hypothetical protein